MQNADNAIKQSAKRRKENKLRKKGKISKHPEGLRQETTKLQTVAGEEVKLNFLCNVILANSRQKAAVLSVQCPVSTVDCPCRRANYREQGKEAREERII